MKQRQTPRPSRRPRSLRRQAGVTLIEVLVAFLIFSFGMLGLVGLQLRTLSYSQSSLMRSQATALADDVLDRMRADRTNAKATSANPWATDYDTDITTITNSDLADWKASVAALLPVGEALIDIAGDGTVTVRIRWDDSRGKDPAQVFTTVTQL